MDHNIVENPLANIIESECLSKTAQKDLYELTEICMDNHIIPGHDIKEQFEAMANKLAYEKEYLELKNKKIENKLENEIISKIQKRQKLRDVLEALYEG